MWFVVTSQVERGKPALRIRYDHKQNESGVGRVVPNEEGGSPDAKTAFFKSSFL